MSHREITPTEAAQITLDTLAELQQHAALSQKQINLMYHCKAVLAQARTVTLSNPAFPPVAVQLVAGPR